MSLKGILTKLSEFFQEPQGSLSSNRLIYISWGLVLLGALLYLTIKNNAFPKVDPTLVLLYATVVAGKAVQSFAEKPTA